MTAKQQPINSLPFEITEKVTNKILERETLQSPLMAPSKLSTSSLPPRRSHLFTPIQEGNESEETDEQHRIDSTTASATSSAYADTFVHQLTPLYEPGKKPNAIPHRPEKFSDDRSVSCTDCRPREKTSMIVVPVDNHTTRNSFSSASPSPNGLFKSLIAGISRRSPKPPPETSSPAREIEERWRFAVGELSRKLAEASRRRDEAVLECSKLNHSMVELEKKLNRLENYCRKLKSGLDSCGFNHLNSSLDHVRVYNRDTIIKNFLISVSESRTSLRFLSKSIASQLKMMGVKVLDRLSMVLSNYDIKLSSSSNPKSLQFYLEALLNNAFYLDFESNGFERNSFNRVMNPVERAETSYVDYTALKGLAWEDVLIKGTKHFSEEFSRFCDRKMSEIVAMLGWNRAWPEPLLQAFFTASKSVWLVHLLANSVHPTLSVFRVEKGVKFDPVYMEDMGGDKTKKLLPTMVRIMVTPGFYVYDNVVKCKVICKYYDNNYSVFSGSNGGNDV